MANRMASELMFRIIHEKPFSNCVVSILEVSAMTQQEFNLTSHAKNFYVDLSRTYKNGMLNGNLLFELFGNSQVNLVIKWDDVWLIQ